MARMLSDTEQANLRAELMVECGAMVEEAMAAMNQAPANNIIGGSEWGVQEAVMKAKNRIYQKLTQASVSKADSRKRESFSPSGQGPRQGDGADAAEQR